MDEIVKQALIVEYQRLAESLASLPPYAIGDQGRTIDATGQRNAILDQMQKIREQLVAASGPSFIQSRFRT